MIRLILITFSILFISSCGIEEVVQPEYITAPSDLTAYPGNGKVKLKFYSNNKEDKFDGFNVYISRSSSLKSQYSLLPVKNPQTGGIPTIIATSKDIDPSVPITVEIAYDADDNPLENGVTYYFIVKSHSIRNFKSDPSNEVSTTPRIDNLTGVILYTNEGFSFSTFSKTTPYNFVFKVQYNPVKKSYIIGKNGTQVQSKGFYYNWEEVNKADADGYIQSDIEVEIKQGYVILFKTSDSHYAKIYIKELNLDTNPYIKFIWAYQTIAGNTDI